MYVGPNRQLKKRDVERKMHLGSDYFSGENRFGHYDETCRAKQSLHLSRVQFSYLIGISVSLSDLIQLEVKVMLHQFICHMNVL